MDEGSTGWMLIGIIPVIIFVVTYVTLYRRQTDAREQAQALAKELEKVNQQLSAYAAQVEDLTIANERQRMARELHDTLSQGLTGIILQLEAIEAHLTNNRVEKAISIVSNAMQQARSTLADARNAIDDLRGAQPENLESALRLEVSRFQNATDIVCDLELKEIPVLKEHIMETVVRNVAEGLTNIGRHAQAQKVTVSVSKEADVLFVTVQDDGQGFDPFGIPSGHYGLLGIRERIRLLGGKLDIWSKSGEGTRLEMRIPV
jgi:NarL family two-component system sensor histidine kinase YdfH